MGLFAFNKKDVQEGPVIPPRYAPDDMHKAYNNAVAQSDGVDVPADVQSRADIAPVPSSPAPQSSSDVAPSPLEASVQEEAPLAPPALNIADDPVAAQYSPAPQSSSDVAPPPMPQPPVGAAPLQEPTGMDMPVAPVQPSAPVQAPVAPQEPASVQEPPKQDFSLAENAFSTLSSQESQAPVQTQEQPSQNIVGAGTPDKDFSDVFAQASVPQESPSVPKDDYAFQTPDMGDVSSTQFYDTSAQEPSVPQNQKPVTLDPASTSSSVQAPTQPVAPVQPSAPQVQHPIAPPAPEERVVLKHAVGTDIFVEKLVYEGALLSITDMQNQIRSASSHLSTVLKNELGVTDSINKWHGLLDAIQENLIAVDKRLFDRGDDA